MSRIELQRLDHENRKELIVMMIQDYKHIQPGAYHAQRNKAGAYHAKRERVQRSIDWLILLACILALPLIF